MTVAIWRWTPPRPGADYVAFGAFFPTTTKETAIGRSRDPSDLAGDVEAPCVAIGGIMAATAGDLARAGADFVAVSSGVWSHPEGPAAAAVRELTEVLTANV